jgi:hypothetical protein
MHHNKRLGACIPAALLASLAMYDCDGIPETRATGADRNVQVSTGVIHDDLMTAGENVRVEAEVNGDVAAAGSTVTVAGPVEGYVMSAGRTVTLDGRIGNDLWAAGQSVQVRAPVENNALVAGRDVNLEPSAAIGHDAHLAGNLVRADGRIGRNLTIGAATAEIGAEVGGDVHANAARVSVLPGAVIHGNLDVTGARPPDISPQARVLGQVKYQKPQQHRGLFTWPVSWLLWLIGLLVMGVAAMAWLPGWTAQVSTILRYRAGWSVLWGVFAVVLFAVAFGVLAITIVGFPLAIALLAVYVLLLLLSGVVVSYRVGDWLLARAHRAQASRWTRIILGTAVVSLGMTLPGLGWIVGMLVVIAGMGALALEWRSGHHFMPATA